MKKFVVALLVALLALIATVALAECEHPSDKVINLDEYKAPTCEEDGYQWRYCNKCGASWKNTIPATGHGKWTVTKEVPATCISKGYKEVVCENGCYVKKEIAIPELNSRTDHPGYKKVVTPATCEENGLIHEYCKDCGTVWEYKVEEKLGHTEDREIDRNGKDTCTTDLVIEYQCTRKNCLQYYTKVVNKIDGHEWSAWTVTDAPKCLTDGVEIRTCANKGCLVKSESRAIPALGHDIVKETIMTNDKGVVVGWCNRCKAYVPTDEKPVVTPEVKPEEKPEEKPTEKPEDKPTTKPTTKPSTPNKPTTNKDGVTIPATGETMNVAPFIMMLVAIVGLAVTKQKVTE